VAAKITPALKQYLEIKKKHEDAILLFRMGDFYEMFFDDALVAAKELEIALTSRSFGKAGEKAPMCGIPHHALETYLPKLIRKGYKVAICEQLEEPKPGKKVVDRGVVRVITPGTYFEDESEERYLMAIRGEKNGEVEVAWADVSSGELLFTKIKLPQLPSLITKFPPKEILIPPSLKEKLSPLGLGKQQFEVKEEDYFTEGAVGALERFIKETQKAFAPKLKEPKEYKSSLYVYIDQQTQKNLELIQPISREMEGATLLSVLDKTKTGMGRRLLKFWILHPLKEKEEIEKRLDAVEELKESFFLSDELRELLSKIYDLERLLTKITAGVATPRELASLRSSLKVLPSVKKVLKEFSSQKLKELENSFDALEDIYAELERVLVENPPTSPKEGGIIKRGVNKELDELRAIKENAEKIIREIERRERERTGISSLKVGFNNVFGYYIEVSKPNLHLVPEDYIRKQTLVNAERFITPELKEFEEKILSAKERIEGLEYQLFCELRRKISAFSSRIRRSAEVIAALDVLQSLARVAQERGYTRPTIREDFPLKIEEGRHPVLEKILEEEFVPNSVNFSDEEFILIITGPNMGGKSVFLRQNALITLMAQIGSFVPAKRAEIGLVDRIFTRVGAADNISKGLSTFMMEMVETANILKGATEKSLLVLDEIGRGTSTYDGVSIAQAVVEYISEKIGAKTLFATHYHELTELEGRVRGVKNYHACVEEIDGHIVFTHQIAEGASERSYGVHVAELAGLPKEVIERAREILSSLEGKGRELEAEFKVNEIPKTIEEPKAQEVEKLRKVEEELKRVEISKTTPLEALLILARLKELFATME